MFQRDIDSVRKSYFYKYDKNIPYSLNIYKKKINGIFTILFLKLVIFQNFP